MWRSWFVYPWMLHYDTDAWWFWYKFKSWKIETLTIILFLQITLSLFLNVCLYSYWEFRMTCPFSWYIFRSVGKTQMNEQSSRSHFVFTLRIYGVNEVLTVLRVNGQDVCTLYLDVLVLFSPCLAFLTERTIILSTRARNNKFKVSWILLILLGVSVSLRADLLETDWKKLK